MIIHIVLKFHYNPSDHFNVTISWFFKVMTAVRGYGVGSRLQSDFSLSFYYEPEIPSKFLYRPVYIEKWIFWIFSDKDS